MTTATPIFLMLFSWSCHFVSPTYVKPNTFLDSRLAKGLWVPNVQIGPKHTLFEGGWVQTPSGNQQLTHICRAKSGLFNNDWTVEPGELLNKTCYISGSPTPTNPSGVRGFKQYEVLLKTDQVKYEWVDFDKEAGIVHNGAMIGGIGSYYEPILICRKFFQGTTGDITKTKAVLGKFKPKDGQCFYEMHFNPGGMDWIKWDVGFHTDKFQLLIVDTTGCSEANSIIKDLLPPV